MIGGLYLVVDALLAVATFWTAHVVRGHLSGLRPLYPAYDFPWIVPLILVIWISTGLATGIYRQIREENLRRAISDPLRVSIIATLVLFTLIFAVKFEYVSRLLLGFFVVFDLAAMILFRVVVRRFSSALRRSLTGPRSFLIVGLTAEAREIAKHIEANEERGTHLVGFVAATGSANETALSPAGLARSYAVHSLARLPVLLRERIIDEVIFAVPREELDALAEAFLICEEEGVKTRLLLSFFPHLISRVSLDKLRDMTLLTFSTTPENDYLLVFKRVVDFILAAALLVALAPLMVLLALAIRLTSAGAVFYRQKRCGLGGRMFTLYKFRSMRHDADLRVEELRALNEADGPVFKIRNDPRCTRVGRFMRKFSLDELPQLFNILRGDMSFVGPRPPLPEEVGRYERWQRRRLRMQPGLTCLWALEGRSKLNFQRWMELDLEYIDNWSPSLDWKILLKTIPVVLLGRGAS